MLVILPAADRFADMEQQLDADLIKTMREGAEKYDVTLAMPRWEFDSKLDLKALLAGMGMTQPFGDEADFSGIYDGGELFISDAAHQGTITVDEQGTEAAAATVLGMPDSVQPAYPVAEMEINRPFIFAIVERDTGTLLFVGRVTNPA
jgi:serpin B